MNWGSTSFSTSLLCTVHGNRDALGVGSVHSRPPRRNRKLQLMRWGERDSQRHGPYNRWKKSSKFLPSFTPSVTWLSILFVHSFIYSLICPGAYNLKEDIDKKKKGKKKGGKEERKEWRNIRKERGCGGERIRSDLQKIWEWWCFHWLAKVCVSKWHLTIEGSDEVGYCDSWQEFQGEQKMPR